MSFICMHVSAIHIYIYIRNVNCITFSSIFSIFPTTTLNVKILKNFIPSIEF